MNYYERFSPDLMKTLKELNDEIIKEEKGDNPNKERIFKLKQQILMKGLEMSVGIPGYNYKRFF